MPGGFGQRGVEGKIAACRKCREYNIPFLGICLGFQVAVIEFARYEIFLILFINTLVMEICN